MKKKLTELTPGEVEKGIKFFKEREKKRKIKQKESAEKTREMSHARNT
jgi:hypothetical protein